jgi:hypothetical protein
MRGKALLAPLYMAAAAAALAASPKIAKEEAATAALSVLTAAIPEAVAAQLGHCCAPFCYGRCCWRKPTPQAAAAT